MEEETESPGPSINWAIIPPSLFTCLLIGLLVIWLVVNLVETWLANPNFSCASYANGLVLGHYHFLLPMVSDTGNFIPEAAIFSFGVIACAVLCKYCKFLYNHHHHHHLPTIRDDDRHHSVRPTTGHHLRPALRPAQCRGPPAPHSKGACPEEETPQTISEQQLCRRLRLLHAANDRGRGGGKH